MTTRNFTHWQPVLFRIAAARRQKNEWIALDSIWMQKKPERPKCAITKAMVLLTRFLRCSNQLALHLSNVKENWILLFPGNAFYKVAAQSRPLRVWWSCTLLTAFFALAFDFQLDAQALLISCSQGVSAGDNGQGTTSPGAFDYTVTGDDIGGAYDDTIIAEETASQNSTNTISSDGNISMVGTGDAAVVHYYGPDPLYRSPSSGISANFILDFETPFTLSCSIAGDTEEGTHLIMSIGAQTLYFTSPGITNSGTLPAGVPISIQLNCVASVAVPSATWQLSFTANQPNAKGDGCNCSDAEPASGEPIDIGTGNMYDGITDYSTRGANQLSFSRYYNSLASQSSVAYTLGKLGKNWRSTYDRYLRGSLPMVAERANGQELTFFPIDETTWASDSDVSVQLLQTSSTTWTLIDNDDTIETYNTVRGVRLLSSIQSRNGYTQTLIYDDSINLTNVTDSFGRQLSFSYLGSGRFPLLSTVTAPNGLVMTYNYDSSSGTTMDRLVSVIYSTTPATTQSYLYENTSLPFALTGIIDEDGNRYVTWSYDSQSRALTSQFAGGADLTSVYYNDSDGSRFVTNALKQVLLYKFAMMQNVPKATEIDRLPSADVPAATVLQGYDSTGYINSQNDWDNNATTLVNDYRGLPLTRNEAVGTTEARTTTTVWHPTLHRPTQITGPGMMTAFVYDSNGTCVPARTRI
jgi:hypothetical protein